jgi:hypothetical protein
LTELERAQQRLVEIRAKYTRPDQQYLKLLIAAWEYHIRILQHAESNRNTL